MKKEIILVTLSVFISITIMSGISYVFSWQEPQAIMPSNYVVPINTTSSAQTKSGDLSVTSLLDANDTTYYINPSGTSYISGKLISETSVLSTDDAGTLTTKDYVDNLPGLTWPDGGQPGDTLIMGITGPFWDSHLTWPGSTKTAFDCDQIGGTVYDTGATGTICRYPGAAVPATWRQAEYWQRFHSSPWGGDSCGRRMSTGPTAFSNAAASYKYKGDLVDRGWSNCATVEVNSACGTSCWLDTSTECLYSVVTVPTTTSNRAEVGIY